MRLIHFLGLRRTLTATVLAGFVSTTHLAGVIAQSTGCYFQLGFANLAAQIPEAVGKCTANERFNAANGNAEQPTEKGLLVWRKADNWTAYTDGYRTWLAGPDGLQDRPNPPVLSPVALSTSPWRAARCPHPSTDHAVKALP